MTVRSVLVIGVAAAALTVSGCAGTSRSDDASPAAGDRNVLAEAELSTARDLDMYQALQRLRPAWLRVRSTGSIEHAGSEGVRVYVDRIPLGGVEVLRGIAVQTVQQVRYLGGADATLQFGTNHGSGAILITTRRGNAGDGS